MKTVMDYQNIAGKINEIIEKRIESCDDPDTKFSARADLIYILRTITAQLEREVDLVLYMKTLGH